MFINILIYSSILLSGSSQDSLFVDVFNAARNGHVQALERLIKINPDTLNAVNSKGYTPLILASYYSQSEVVKFLLENDVNINFISSQGTALCGVAYKGDIVIAKLLIQYGAELDIQDDNGTSPLLYATLLGHTKLAKLLLTFGADPTLEDNEGLNPIKCAEQLKNTKLTDLFKSKL